MKKKIKYTDEPIGELKIIKDFLPTPDQLILKEDQKEKITLSLSKKSIHFFKNLGQQNNIGYQKLIRKVLDSYVDYFNK